jgi:DNA-binding CsgD family transcriptional regulator
VKGNKNRRSRHSHGIESQLHPKTFVFFDRTTGTKRFEIKAGADGSLPVEETISLLAMQCVVRGQTPTDFRIMVSIGNSLMDGLAPRTRKLIQDCMATVLPMNISKRQQEVLGGVLQQLSNKEIAAKLNLAERTVKFHISALLQKFHVTGRMRLMQKAGDIMMSADRAPTEMISAELPAIVPVRAVRGGIALHPKFAPLAASERRAGR